MMQDLTTGPPKSPLSCPTLLTALPPGGAENSGKRNHRPPHAFHHWVPCSQGPLMWAVAQGPGWGRPAAFGIWGAAEGHLGSGIRLSPCWHFSPASAPGLRFQKRLCSWEDRAVLWGAVAVVSGDEMERRALRSELGSISGLSLVGRGGRAGK